MDLPQSPEALASATWADVAPYYEALATAPLTAADASSWLREWSRLEELIGEAAAVATVEYTCDTENAAKEAAHLRFAAEIAPKQDEQQVRLARRLLGLGWEEPELATVLRRLRTDAALFREENVHLFAELEELETSSAKITAAITGRGEGHRLPIRHPQPFLNHRVGAVRDRAFRGMPAPYLERRTRSPD